jgi:hypothetical protein
MRTWFRAFSTLIPALPYAALIVAIATGLAFAQQAAPPAQPPTASKEQQSTADKAQHTQSGKTGTSEPNAHADAAKLEDTGVLVNGRLNVPGAPPDSQTVPAKFSERNATLDELPTMAQPMHLSADERRRIWDVVSKDEASRTAFDARPAQVLPSTVELQEFPRELSGSIPGIAGCKFARLRDKLLLVQPANRIVVGVIPAPDSPGAR